MSPAPVEYTVFLIEDTHPFQQAVKNALADHERFKYLGCEWDRDKVEKMIVDHAPDLAIVDMRLPVPRTGNALAPVQKTTEEGLRTLERIKELSPQTLTIACSDYFITDHKLARQAMQRGADAILAKYDTPTEEQPWGEWLRSQLSMIAQGQFIPTAEVARMLEETVMGLMPDEDVPAVKLSTRELEVLHLMAKGNTAKQIAAALHIEPTTVRSHTRNIVRRLHAINQADAVQRARKMGTLGRDDALPDPVG